MGVEINRYFDGFYKGFLYHIYVTKIDVLCVRMGRDVPAAGYHGGGLVGGLAAARRPRPRGESVASGSDVAQPDAPREAPSSSDAAPPEVRP